jgi:hypothetical protein
MLTSVERHLFALKANEWLINTPQLSRMDLANHCAASPGPSLLNIRAVQESGKSRLNVPQNQLRTGHLFTTYTVFWFGGVGYLMCQQFRPILHPQNANDKKYLHCTSSRRLNSCSQTHSNTLLPAGITLDDVGRMVFKAQVQNALPLPHL